MAWALFLRIHVFIPDMHACLYVCLRAWMDVSIYVYVGRRVCGCGWVMHAISLRSSL